MLKMVGKSCNGQNIFLVDSGKDDRSYGGGGGRGGGGGGGGGASMRAWGGSARDDTPARFKRSPYYGPK